VPVITGDEINHWCCEHLKDAAKTMKIDLGLEAYNFLFSKFRHQLWFWGADIQATLAVAAINYISERSKDIYGTSIDDELLDDIEINATILKIKVREYRGAISMTELGESENIRMVGTWMRYEYIDKIGGPLGEETIKIAHKHGMVPVKIDVFNHLVGLVLAAKRAERYLGHDLEKQLISMETALWATHRAKLN
jgi:hypothetical protein